MFRSITGRLIQKTCRNCIYLLVWTTLVFLSVPLKAQEKTYTLKDTLVYLDLARKFYETANKQDLPQAEKILSELDKFLKDSGWKRGFPSYYYSEAVLFEYRHMPAKAIESYKRSYELSKALHNKTEMAKCLSNIGSNYYDLGEYVKAIEYYNMSLPLRIEAKDRSGESRVYNLLGNVYIYLSDFNRALDYYQKSLHIEEALNNQTGIASSLGNIGILYRRNDNFPKALEYINKAIAIYEKLGEKRGVAKGYGNLAVVYSSMKDYAHAAEASIKSKDIYLELKEKRGYARTLNNMAEAYIGLKDYDKAGPLLEEAIGISSELKDRSNLSSCYYTLGRLQMETGNYKAAISSLNASAAISKEMKTGGNLFSCYEILSLCYEKKGQFDSAYFFYHQFSALKDSVDSEDQRKDFIRKESKYEYEKKEALATAEFEKQQLLSASELRNKQILLEKNGQALQLLQKENILKMLMIEKSESELNRKNAQALNQKKEIQLLNKDKQLKVAEAEKKEKELAVQRSYLLFALAGIALMVILVFIAYRNYRIKQRASNELARKNDIITLQKETVEKKNQEILDSINYAKRLQEAILPPASMWEQYLPHSFILYKPKDIVAGDFYFMEQKDGKVFFATADCTGHGVPGAMVSVVCSNALTRSVKEFGLQKPGKILDKVRELVLETFSKSESDVKDGMDISLCVFDKKTGTLEWAGANNPLWIFRKNGGPTHDFIELKPDKQPIGKSSDPFPFKSHEVVTQPGDMIYLFTDGYADQFGLSAEAREKADKIIKNTTSTMEEIRFAKATLTKGKKFKSANMRELFAALLIQDLHTQKATINSTFEQWKGELEQVDDVCVIGIRL